MPDTVQNTSRVSENGRLLELVEMSSSSFSDKDIITKSSKSSLGKMINELQTFDVEVNKGLPMNEIKRGTYKFD